MLTAKRGTVLELSYLNRMCREMRGKKRDGFLYHHFQTAIYFIFPFGTKTSVSSLKHAINEIQDIYATVDSSGMETVQLLQSSRTLQKR